MALFKLVLISFIIIIMGKKGIDSSPSYIKEANNSSIFLLKSLATSRKVGSLSKFYRVPVTLYSKKLKERIGNSLPLGVLAITTVRVLLAIRRLNCKL